MTQNEWQKWVEWVCELYQLKVTAAFWFSRALVDTRACACLCVSQWPATSLCQHTADWRGHMTVLMLAFSATVSTRISHPFCFAICRSFSLRRRTNTQLKCSRTGATQRGFFPQVKPKHWMCEVLCWHSRHYHAQQSLTHELMKEWILLLRHVQIGPIPFRKTGTAKTIWD